MLVTKSQSKIYRQARHTGALSLAAKELREFPIEVCDLHEHLEEDEKFWECVDLHKIDMSHNLICSIPAKIQNMAETLTSLKLSQNQITNLPMEIFELKALQFLDLSNNRLRGQGISNQICQLSGLKELILANNELTILPETIGELRQLDTLAIEHNVIQSLPSSIGLLSVLRKLTASSNQLRCLPVQINNLTALEMLDCSKNCLTDVPALDGLKELKFFDGRQNSLTHCPVFGSRQLDQVFLGYNRLCVVDVDFLESVEQTLSTLDLRDNQLDVLPDQICRLSKLKLVDVCNNNLSDLPAGLGYLKLLNRLLIDGNSLRAIRRSIVTAGHEALKKYLRTRGAPPQGVDTLDEETDEFTPGHTDYEFLIRDAIAYKVLNLDGRDLQAIPDAVLQHEQMLASLTSWSVSNNALERLPMNLAHCTKLQKLIAENNQLESIPEALLQLFNLQVLSLKRNKLSSDGVDQFFAAAKDSPMTRSLRELDLSCNQLTHVPATIEVFRKLSTLQMSYNRIKTLEGVRWKDFVSLCSVSVSDNQLESLGRIYEVGTLTALNIENNNLTDLPAELATLNLNALLINGNPQRTVRSNIIAKGTEAILECLGMKIAHGGRAKCDKKSVSEELESMANLVTRRMPTTTPAVRSSESDESSCVTVHDDESNLSALQGRIRELEEQLEDYSLTQAKKYAVKKDLAKVRALKIREERRLESK